MGQIRMVESVIIGAGESSCMMYVNTYTPSQKNATPMAKMIHCWLQIGCTS